MAFYVLLEAGGVPVFMTDEEGAPIPFDTASDATYATGNSALARAFGYAVIEVPTGLIQMTRVIE